MNQTFALLFFCEDLDTFFYVFPFLEIRNNISKSMSEKIWDINPLLYRKAWRGFPKNAIKWLIIDWPTRDEQLSIDE